MQSIPRPLISAAIPSYNEHEYIVDTVAALLQQSAFTKRLAEIIVADYDPDGNELTRKAIDDNFTRPNVKYIKVHGRGIAHARHFATLNSLGRYIVCFDADTRFNRPDALELLTAPLAAGRAIFTCCDNIFPDTEIDPNSPPSIYIKGCCAFQRMAPICCLEPGFSFLKSRYEEVGGFDDVNWAEALMLSQRFLYQFGASSKEYVEDVHVITSARRAKMLDKLGLGVFDYRNAVRGDKILKT